ncbi:AAA family ATPase [Nocardia sp. NPDC049190]|uniref:ATP-binding protein n=1 Tax=Nocardia sp. NPDC049190 TaxID=3155650 RepID=UPI0033F2466D
MVSGSRDRVITAANFIGRNRELETITTLLLGSTRLITLTGPGGIGKTRLAAETVRQYHKARKGPVHWARLARLGKNCNRTAVEEEVAKAVLDVDFSGRSVFDALVETLTVTDAAGRARQVVLVLDNCEHVVFAAGELIAELLEAVPGLSIVATSRKAIGWVDEQLVEVRPLTRKQALTLFQQRAEMAGHLVDEPEQITAAESICRHVHNHPLYIQLAAAQLRRQSLVSVLNELSGLADDRRMRWSSGSECGTEPRHRAVVDVISWSYDLCDDKERLLVDRMSVFAAGYDPNPEDNTDGDRVLDVGADLEAIQAVCADDPGHVAAVSVMADEVEGLLERLVDQSLVSVHRTATTTRYSLPESTRVFAKQRLIEHSTGEAAEEPARLAELHRHYYHDKIVYARAHWFGPAEKNLLYWARAEWDNLLTAIESSLTAPGESALGLEICTGLIGLRVPFFAGALRETRCWTETALAATRKLSRQPTQLQTDALAQLVLITLCQGQREDAEQMLEDCIASCLPEARAGWRQDPGTDIGLPGPAEFAWGAELLLARSDPQAITVSIRARDKARDLGNNGAAAMYEMFAALAASLLGTPQQAHEITRHHLDHATESGASWTKSWAELVRAIALTRHGSPTEALAIGRTALARQLPTGDQWGALWAVEIRIWSLAQIITDTASAERPNQAFLTALATEAAQLAGGAKTFRTRLGVDIEKLGPIGAETTNAIGIVRRVLGDNRFSAEETLGCGLRPELAEVQKLAMGTLPIQQLTPAHRDRVDSQSPWNELSPTERQVAILAAAGWANTAIAARRGSSPRTIDAQISAILQKLAISSRTEIIGFVPENLINHVRTETTRRPHRTSHATH